LIFLLLLFLISQSYSDGGITSDLLESRFLEVRNGLSEFVT